MREQLIQYVNLLFAGTPDSEDIRQEILQNTLDRYDDLVSQGKSPEAAYRLAISGIGDINEILAGNHREPEVSAEPIPAEPVDPEKEKTAKIANAVAIALFILCPVPLFIIGSTVGLCLLLAMVAAGIALMVIYDDEKKHPKETIIRDTETTNTVKSARKKLHQSVSSIVWAVGVAVYFIVSFGTGAWYITWVIFPIIGCVSGLINAIIDLKEAVKNEN